MFQAERSTKNMQQQLPEALKEEMPLKALILAGGRGTRLQQVVSDRPKGMADVCGKPFLEYQIESLRSWGVHEIVMAVGYRAQQILDYFQDGKPWQVTLSYVIEDTPRGTAGAIKKVGPLLGERFLVLNGDTFWKINVQEFLTFHGGRRLRDQQVLGTVALVQVKDTRSYGAIEVDPENRILRFSEKSDSAGSSWINAGLYLLESRILDFIPDQGFSSMEMAILPSVMQGGWHLYGYPTDGFFVDIGTPEGYTHFIHYIKGGIDAHPE